MSKFISNPVTIEAVQVIASDINEKLQVDGLVVSDSPSWLVDALARADLSLTRKSGSDYAHVAVLNKGNIHVAAPGDWIIYLNDKDIYVCPNEVFQTKYTAA